MSASILLEANLGAVLLGAAVAIGWARHPGRRLYAATTFAALGLAGFAYLSLVTAQDIPVSWLTVMHYGSEKLNIAHLYGRGVHAGDNFTAVTEWVSGNDPLRLRHVVHLNLGLAVLNAVAFFALAVRLQSIGWAIPWTLAFSFNPSLFYAAFSELPAHLTHAYLFTSVLAWAALTDGQPQPRWFRGLALLLLSLLTALVAATRIEASIPGVVALATWAIPSCLGEARWIDLRTRTWNGIARPLAFLSAHPLLVAVLCFIGLLLLLEGPGSDRTRWAIAALYPFNPEFFLAAVFPTVLALPVGVSVAMIAGAAFALLRFRQTGGLAFSLWLLANLYSIAIGLYASLRYMSNALGLFLLLGLLGRAGFEEVARRQAWPQRWRQIALVLYVMAWCTLPPLSALEPYLRPQYDPNAGIVEQLLLDRNTQREVRFLTAQIEAHPDCIFIARALKDHAGAIRDVVWTYIAFGKSVDRPITIAADKLTLEEMIARYAPAGACVRLYHGDDCNLTYTGGCKDFVGDRQPLSEWRFWSQPFNDPRERGFAAPEVLLATYAWP